MDFGGGGILLLLLFGVANRERRLAWRGNCKRPSAIGTGWRVIMFMAASEKESIEVFGGQMLEKIQSGWETYATSNKDTLRDIGERIFSGHGNGGDGDSTHGWRDCGASARGFTSGRNGGDAGPSGHGGGAGWGRAALRER